MDKDVEIDEEKKMPDMAAREPAEGDIDFPVQSHLCCPEEEPSSKLPVENAALAEMNEEQPEKK